MAEEAFDWVSLDAGEKVLWAGSPKITSIIPMIAIGALLLPVMGLGVIVMAAAYLQITNTDFVVTSQGLYKKRGVLSRSVQKIGFDKVQNISFSQGVFGNYFGYGNVEISTAGGSGVEMRFRSIEEPRKVQELINRNIKNENGDEKGTMEKVLDELKAIRESVENIEERV